MDNNGQTELDKWLNGMRDRVQKGKLVEEIELNSGWSFVRDTMQGMCDAYSADILSNKYVNDHNGYLTQLGAYNALKSVLDTLQNFKNTGLVAQQQLAQAEADNAAQLNQPKS